MRKIYWTKAETESVFTRAIEIMHWHGLSAFESLRQAQTVLPENRRRAFNTHSACGDLINKLKKVFATHVEPVKPTMAPTVAPTVPTPMVEPSSAPTEVSLDGLVEAIVARIAGMVKAQVRTAVKELEHEFRVEKHNPTYQSTGVHKPRVVIIGLLNDQVHLITREFGQDFNVKCIDTDRAMGMEAPDADAYLLMKNFINHPLYHKYQKFHNHVLIDGGMSTLRMWFNTKGKEL
tara:strand:- start:559 stop:1260 length:702 start_codon:yes stop_codon:yes gene_type:complete